MITIVLCLALVAACIKPLGCYMACIYTGKARIMRIFGGPERIIYRACGIDANLDMSWRSYAIAILMLGFFGFLLLFTLFVAQGVLPLNPQNLPGLSPDLAFNAAISFVTNTNWQSYGGESTLSYLSQSLGCAVQNFLSAATGMAVAVALARGLVRKQSHAIGNAYADVVRSILYILLPMSLLFALILASQGVVQTYAPYVQAQLIEPQGEVTTQTIAVGPAASQIAIKMLGSNGGGFFNVNGAHPFENPTPLSNLLQLVSILLIPAAFAYTFGELLGDRRQGWMLIAAMSLLFLPALGAALYAESVPNPRMEAAVSDAPGNMEGKEVRFGSDSSVLWGVATTATSNGSVNAMHDSFMPLTGLVLLLMMQLGEVVFGGVGSGAYGIMVFVLLTVFIGGLMVGRTPEYMGKKLGIFEIKMASLILLLPGALVLIGTAIALMTEAGRAGIFNSGAQGFSEVLYAFSSAANNNGSAFGGLSANSPFYNIALGICMFLGRYWVIVPVLAIAGSFAAKNTVPISAGTLPTHTPLFTGMLVGIVLLMAVLTYMPALALGPIVEHLHLYDTRGDTHAQ